MSKVTITLQDVGQGKVKVVVDPTCHTLAQKDLSGHGITLAEGLALFAANRILEQMKLENRNSRLIIPTPGLRGRA